MEMLDGAELQPASGDASFRRYFRVRAGGQTFIAMDAPPPQEDCQPFMRVSGYLEAMRLNAPRVIESDPEQGFLLLTDLGEVQYFDRLRQQPAAAPALYRDALRALQWLQNRGSAYQSALPPYDEDLLRFELSLFRDWLCGTHLGIAFNAAELRQWQRVCDLLVYSALDQPLVFVHRDYHSRNLMLTAVDNPGILDFQDAVEGPLTYDLVSLLKDCYLRWSPQQVRDWALEYYRDLDAVLRRQVDEGLFMRYFELMGVQRHLKAAGIFARLNHRDGKLAYMADIPRTLNYIVELGPDYEELEFLVSLIAGRCLPALEAGE
jgi:aminoglycoside/choline kinase family phosphotransferase